MNILVLLALLVGFFQPLHPGDSFHYYAEYYQRCTVTFHETVVQPPPLATYNVISVQCGGETVIPPYHLNVGDAIAEEPYSTAYPWPRIASVEPGLVVVRSNTKAERFVTYTPLLLNEGATP